MGNYAKRILSWVLALTLLTTCAISGLVLPATADDAVRFTETFDGETTLAATLWDGTGTLTEDPKNSANKVLYFASDVSNKYNKTSFGLQPNKTYCLSVDFYGTQIKIDTYSGAGTVSATGLADASAWTKPGTAWKTVNYLFRTTDSVNANWAFNVDAKAGSYMDNLIVKEVDFGDNLILGGDLEYGVTTVWENNTNVQAGVGRDGSWGIKTVSSASALTPAVRYKHTFNALLEANTTYIFSYDYKHEGVGRPQMYVDISADGNVGMKTTLLEEGDYDWKTATFEFTTGTSVNANGGWEWQVRQVQYDTEAGTGASYFDNFKLIKKPAGATAIELDKAEAELTVGDELDLTVTAWRYRPSSGRPAMLRWRRLSAAR